MKNVKMLLALIIAVVCFSACNDDEGNTQICKDDSVVTPPLPESGSNCFFPEETIWEWPSPQTIELDIAATGQVGVEITIEYEGEIFQDLSISPAPALPQFQSIEGAVFEDVVAVHVRCDKEPSNGCADCLYEYQVCIL